MTGMDISVLASGSGGNAVYLEASPGNGVLVDAGISRRDLTKRLAMIGRGLESVRAVLITHDHNDHCKGLPALLRHAPHARVYATEATARAVELNRGVDGLPWHIFDADARFEAGGVSVRPVRLPHDAAEPLGFVLEAGGTRAGVATDFGHATPALVASLASCHALVLEFNHDVLMLENSGRPPELVRRILGPRGHLSNDDAGALLERAATGGTRRVFLAHLSAECNTPGHALGAARAALARAGRGDVELVVASQGAPTAFSAC